MFAADAQLQIGPRRAAFLDTHPDERADTLAVNRDERVARVDFRIGIGMHEGTGVITADAKCGLCQVIRAEGEEFGLAGKVIRADGRAGQLDHGADEIFDAGAGLAGDRLCLGIDHRLAESRAPGRWRQAGS